MFFPFVGFSVYSYSQDRRGQVVTARRMLDTDPYRTAAVFLDLVISILYLGMFMSSSNLYFLMVILPCGLGLIFALYTDFKTRLYTMQTFTLYCLKITSLCVLAFMALNWDIGILPLPTVVTILCIAAEVIVGVVVVKQKHRILSIKNKKMESSNKIILNNSSPNENSDE